MATTAPPKLVIRDHVPMSIPRRALGTGPSNLEPTGQPTAGTRQLPVQAAVPVTRTDVEHQAVEQLAPPRRRPLGTGPAGA